MTNKVLFLGTNDVSTDQEISKLATINGEHNYGLVSDSKFVPKDDGYYHTTIVDIWSGGIIEVAKHFDKIQLLDQPKDQWSHWKSLLSTYKIMVELEKLGHCTEFRNNENIKSIQFMWDLLQDNKAFCVYPWMHLLEEYGDVLICSKSKTPIKKLEDLEDWRTDPEFVEIRDKLKGGERIHNCNLCYEEEDLGFVSTRVHESMDWAVKMNIQSMEDLEVALPTYYEVRPSNKCNLQCRMCCPENSHLIEKEFKEIKFEYPSFKKQWGNYEHIDVENLLPGTRIYSTGGEPTIIPEFYNFLDKCIALGRTDLDITLNTNGQKVNDKLVNLMHKFDEVNFSFSIDGYDRVNEYIRWNSVWDKTVVNAKRLRDEGFYVSLECIPSPWNITNLHLLYEFYDREFPDSTVFLQQVYWPDKTVNVFNHPLPELVVDSLTRVIKTNAYYTDARDNKSIIDTLLEHYSKDPKPDLHWLGKFYEFNDLLDKSRNVKLVDYVPELEQGRKLL